MQKPAAILRSPRLRSSQEWLVEANKLLEESSASGSFNRETQGKFESILALVQADRMSSYDREIFNGRVSQRKSSREIDPATLAFFSGGTPSDKLLSESGGQIQQRDNARIGGRAVGNVTELRDISYSLGIEARTYTGLNIGTGSLGGFTIPIGFWPEVQFALRQIDGLWASARMIVTPTGNALNVPTAFESNVGRQLGEAVAVNQNNPAFGQVAWSQCPMWSSDQIVTSVQFAEDCGAPNVVELMRQIFAIRISVGLGGQFTSTLLTNAQVGVTTASPTAITPAEIMSLPTKLSNAQYGYKATSGWLMSAATLEYVYSLLGTSGNRVFPKKFDDDTGLPLLLEQPVYLSPNFGAIGSSSKVVAFGDLSRFWIRTVGDSFAVFRYNETFMPRHQYGWQAWLRADGQLVSADAGVSDFPIVLLQCHS